MDEHLFLILRNHNLTARSNQKGTTAHWITCTRSHSYSCMSERRTFIPLYHSYMINISLIFHFIISPSLLHDHYPSIHLIKTHGIRFLCSVYTRANGCFRLLLLLPSANGRPDAYFARSTQTNAPSSTSLCAVGHTSAVRHNSPPKKKIKGKKDNI